MKKIDLENLKKIELGALRRIDQLCKENHLRYYLIGGTLLGAIRHKGFIPWDDDIDIAMPRSDYEKLLKLFETDDQYIALSYKNTERYYYNFAKVIDKSTVLTEGDCLPIEGMGVYVDVFPLDGMPGNEEERNRHFQKLYSIRKKINSFCVSKPKIRKNLFAYLLTALTCLRNKFLDLNKLQEEYERLAKKYDYDSAPYIYLSGGAYKQKEIFKKEAYESATPLEFEGFEFDCPIGYDACMKQMYGNYMQLPPPEKRVTHHVFTATYK